MKFRELMDKILPIVMTILMLFVLIFGIICFNITIVDNRIDKKLSTTAYATTYKPNNTIQTEVIVYEEPNESELIADALVAQIGTETEKEAFGYDYTFVAQVVMAESGANSQDLQLAICQLIMNRAHKLKTTPEEICRDCYTVPVNDINDSVWEACERIFIRGEVYEKVGNADICYNPIILGTSSDYHEKQIYVCTIDDVRIFEER